MLIMRGNDTQEDKLLAKKLWAVGHVHKQNSEVRGLFLFFNVVT